MGIRDEMLIREIKVTTKSRISLASLILEELTQAIEFAEGMGGGEKGDMTPIQRKVWGKYKTQTLQFAHDMMW